MSLFKDRIIVEDLNYYPEAEEMDDTPISHPLLLLHIGSGRSLASRQRRNKSRSMPPLPTINPIVTPHVLCSPCRRSFEDSRLLARTQAKLDSRWIITNISSIQEPEDSRLDLEGDFATFFLFRRLPSMLL
jgi:hypothetical protein